MTELVKFLGVETTTTVEELQNDLWNGNIVKVTARDEHVHLSADFQFKCNEVLLDTNGFFAQTRNFILNFKFDTIYKDGYGVSCDQYILEDNSTNSTIFLKIYR